MTSDCGNYCCGLLYNKTGINETEKYIKITKHTKIIGEINPDEKQIVFCTKGLKKA